MGKANTTRTHIDESAPRRRRPALRTHTFGTWQAVYLFHQALPVKKRYYPTIDEIQTKRAELGLPAISREAVNKHLGLLVEAGKIVRREEGRRDITWVAPYDENKATEEVAKLNAEDGE